MDGLIELHVLVPVTNRPGVFAVLPQQEAHRLKAGYKKLYWRKGALFCETITRTRTLFYAPLVFVAVDPEGNLVTETIA